MMGYKYALSKVIQQNQPSFFPFLVSASLIVVGAVGGGAGARLLTTSVTVAPESRSTCTALAYSTFSRGTPFTETMRSFTLQLRKKSEN